MTYTKTDDTVLNDDDVYIYNGVSVREDSLNKHYLNGATVDYISNGGSNGFQIHNPNYP